VLGGPPVGEDLDGVGGDVVVLIVRGLFFEGVDEDLEIRRGNGTDQLIRRDVVEVDHRLR
jgi:hypothetical protein